MNNNDFDINSIINGTSSNTTNVNNNPAGVTPQQDTSPFPNTGVSSTDNNAINNMTAPTDPNAQVNEKLKRVEIDYKPPGKFKIFLMIIFFIFIIAFALFLPEISEYINLYKAGKLNQVSEEITSGKLTCTLKSNTANLDMDYTRVFYFTDLRLKSADFKVVTRGDPTQDEQTLDGLNQKCVKLSQSTKSLSGINVSCDYTDGKLTEHQKFEYASINVEEIDSAFAEAGGNLPEFKNDQDITDIEKKMNSAGYSCLKEK